MITYENMIPFINFFFYLIILVEFQPLSKFEKIIDEYIISSVDDQSLLFIIKNIDFQSRKLGISFYPISNSYVIRLFSWFKYNFHYLFFLIKPFISFWCIIKLHCMGYYLGWIYASCFNKMEQLFIVFFYRT